MNKAFWKCMGGHFGRIITGREDKFISKMFVYFTENKVLFLP